MRWTLDRIRLRMLAASAVVATVVTTGVVHAQITTRVSVSSAGVEGNDFSFLPSISADGRFASFTSAASNLVPNDTNGVRDIFVHDRTTGETSRVSLASDGAQTDAHSGSSAISGDGRFVAFASTATNLVPDDTNGVNDVFLHDRETGETRRVSVSSAREQANDTSHTPAISADGRYVAFESAATNLVPGITNSVWDIFVYDRVTEETTRISVSSSGGQSNGDSRWASISADGRFISFTSSATTLVLNTPPFTTQVYIHDRDTGQTERVSVSSSGEPANDVCSRSAVTDDGRSIVFSSLAGNLDPADLTASEDVFLHDRKTAETSLVSVSSAGEQANSWSFWPTISGDGRFAAFVTDASNLVPDDTNNRRDVYLRDLQNNTTTRVSVSSRGEQGADNSGFFSGPSISADGLHICFESFATTLVPDDTNGVNDVFIHGPQWPSDAPGDINGDGEVNVDDLLVVLNNWGDCDDCGDCPADVTGDCTVNVDDLLVVLNNWG